jgi:hypothetical protein
MRCVVLGLLSSDSVTSPDFNLLDIYTATNSILRVQADGQGIWRSMGDDSSAEIRFHRAYIISGLQKKVANGDIIR